MAASTEVPARPFVVSVKTMSGDISTVELVQEPPVTVGDLRRYLTELQGDGRIVSLHRDDAKPLDDTDVLDEGEELCTVVMLSRRRVEDESMLEWVEIAQGLRAEHDEAEGQEVFAKLCEFLDSHPELINFQYCCRQYQSLETEVTAPLLSFAVESRQDTHWRRSCVHELLRRKACIRTMVVGGAALAGGPPKEVIARAERVGSVFLEDLALAATSYQSYEEQGIKLWRGLTADMCGEGVSVSDETVLPRLQAFLDTYPELDNFQNNHAVNASGRPLGYWGFTTLLNCAACRAHQRGFDRRPVIDKLLQHGAKIDVEQGGKTTIGWYKHEGNLNRANYLEQKLSQPILSEALTPEAFCRSV